MLQSREPIWPFLRVPRSPVLRIENRILLCYFCYRIGPSNSWVRVGRREIQLRLCRAGGRRVSKRINSLRYQGILERNERRPTCDTYRYRLSSEFLNTAEYHDWRQLADLLFSNDLPWKALFDRPVVGHGFLNASGVVVLGAILAAGCGVSTGDLQRYLRGLVGEQTVRNAIRKLEEIAVVSRDADFKLVPASDWKVRLDDFESAVGAKFRARQIYHEIRIERELYHGSSE